MAEKQQLYANHVRWDPLFHFFVVPVALLSIIGAAIHAYRFPSPHSIWLIVAAIAAAIAVLKLRLYALRVQDRVIRLEERLRLAILLPEPLRGRVGELSVGQLVGLRFASDAELPALVQRALAEKLDRKQIKQAVVSWRADDLRV